MGPRPGRMWHCGASSFAESLNTASRIVVPRIRLATRGALLVVDPLPTLHRAPRWDLEIPGGTVPVPAPHTGRPRPRARGMPVVVGGPLEHR